jgi:cold shock CspA family protein
MGRSRETYGKKEVRTKKEKKRKEKLAKKLAKRETEKKGTLDDMIAYVDENGNITSTPQERKPEPVDPEDIEISIPRSDGKDADNTRAGIVSMFNTDKGFGFIRDLQTKVSYFFHVNDLKEDVQEGDRVSFEKGKGPKGPVALNVEQQKT